MGITCKPVGKLKGFHKTHLRSLSNKKADSKKSKDRQ